MIIAKRSKETWLKGIAAPKIKVNEPIRNWLVQGNWMPRAGMSKSKITADIYAVDQLSDHFTSEIIKLSIAALSSSIHIENNVADERSSAWQLVRYYYAAYYAANALMRFSGHACTNLDTADCTQINTVAALYGVGGNTPKDKLNGGVFHLKITEGPAPNFTLTNAPGKGVHVQLWLVFLEYLKDLKSRIKQSPAPKADIAQAIQQIELIENEFKREGGGWLSDIRNAVNYRFEHSAWYPYMPSNVTRTELRTSFRTHTQGGTAFAPTAGNDHELIRAVRVCGFLVGWLVDSLSIVSSSAQGGKKSAIKQGVLDLTPKI